MAKRKFTPKSEPCLVSVCDTKPPITRKKREKKQTETQEIDNQFFIMVDGEGQNDVMRDYYYDDSEGNCFRITDRKQCKRSQYQKYVLLCSSTGESIHNPNGLSSGECLHFLCDLSLRYPRGIFIVFGGTYDATMWLRDLKFEQLKAVREYANVPNKSHVPTPKTSVFTLDGKYYVYGVNYLPRKFLELTRYEVQMVPHKRNNFVYKRDTRGKKIRHGSITVWDVWGFFQCRFAKSVAEYGLLAEQKDTNFLENMKNSRNQFSKMDIEMIKKYCFMECELGVELMNKVRGFCRQLGLELKRWDGAGAISSSLMNFHKIKEHKSGLPPDVEEVVKHSFSGGRIELIQYGHTDKTIYDADINSAYPFITSRLPSMHGEWKLSQKIESEWALVHIKWNLTSNRARFFPFFFRDEDGCISYPTKGENWVCLPEYQSYLKNEYLYQGTVDLLEVFNFFPESEAKPFGFIPELAAQRLIWKREFRDSGGQTGGQHIMAKTGLNGIFGKTAQTVGMYTDEKGKVHTPPFHNLFWASWITASTRARLFDAACQKPEDVVMFATDGLFSLTKPDLPYSENLGEWELSTCEGMTFVQSGVYYSKKIEKTRGFEKGSITEKMIIEKWLNKEWDADGSTQQFVSYGMLATSCRVETIQKNMKRLANWETKERQLSLTPNGTKREYDPKCNPLQKRGPNPAKNLIPTIPKSNDCIGISYPYELHMEYVLDQEMVAEHFQMEV